MKTSGGGDLNVFPLEAPYPDNLSYAEVSYEILAGRDVARVPTVQNDPAAQTRAWISPASMDAPFS